jgi:hypothetical protein
VTSYAAGEEEEETPCWAFSSPSNPEAHVCAVLILKTPSVGCTGRRRFAQRERIVCVEPRWVEDCLSRGCWLDEAPYLVVDREDPAGMDRCGCLLVAFHHIQSNSLRECENGL